MEKDINKYDQYLKDAFENFEVNAPDSVWQGIENGIQQTPQIPSDSGLSSSIGNGVLKTLAGLKLKAAIVVLVASIAAGTLVYNLVDSNEDNQININKEIADSSLSALKDENQELNQEEINQISNSAEASSNLGDQSDNGNKTSTSSKGDKNVSKSPNPKPSEPKAADKQPINPEKNEGPAEKSLDNRTELICLNTLICPGQNLGVQVKSSKPWILKSNSQELLKGNGDGDFQISFEKLLGSSKIFLCNENGQVLAYKSIKVDNIQARIEIIELDLGRYQFNPNINSYSKLEWDFGDGNKAQEVEPIHQYSFASRGIRNVKFTAWSINNCKLELNQNLDLSNLPKYNEPKIPNVITPDLVDNLNDDFNILIENEEFYHLVITDLSGQIVFESYDKNNRFNGVNVYNGNSCPAGNYQFIFQYKLKGYPNSIKKGVFTIIRNR